MQMHTRCSVQARDSTAGREGRWYRRRPKRSAEATKQNVVSDSRDRGGGTRALAGGAAADARCVEGWFYAVRVQLGRREAKQALCLAREQTASDGGL